ncbi:hypothetical protein J437_LFUL008214, partial [Ladona fulva]
IDAYWISKGFYQCVNKFQEGLPNLIDCTKGLLEKEDGTLFSSTREEVLKHLNNINEETADVIANKAIEMWQQHGSALTPGVGPDSMKAHSMLHRSKPSYTSL